jgi:hypothetical protein
MGMDGFVGTFLYLRPISLACIRYCVTRLTAAMCESRMTAINLAGAPKAKAMPGLTMFPVQINDPTALAYGKSMLDGDEPQQSALRALVSMGILTVKFTFSSGKSRASSSMRVGTDILTEC